MLEFWFNTQVPTFKKLIILIITCLLYTSPSPRDNRANVGGGGG
ncbi:hypothetical protein ACN6P7_08055, partial [Acinetobacter baumannii]